MSKLMMKSFDGVERLKCSKLGFLLEGKWVGQMIWNFLYDIVGRLMNVKWNHSPPWPYLHRKLATCAYCLWSNMLRYVASPVVRDCNESIAFCCLIPKKWWPSDKNGFKREFPLKNVNAFLKLTFFVAGNR